MVCAAIFLKFRKIDVSVVIFASERLRATGEVTHPPMLIVMHVTPLDLARVTHPCMIYAFICVASLCDTTADYAW